MARNSVAVLYHATDAEGVLRYFGCWKATGRRTEIFRGFSEEELDGLALTLAVLRGRFAVVEDRGVGRQEPVYGLTAFDLKRGRVQWQTEPAEWEVPTEIGPPHRVVRSIRMLDTGSAVWTARNPDTNPVKRQVYAVGRGKRRMLDPGPSVDTASLRLRGHRATWISAGVRRAAIVR